VNDQIKKEIIAEINDISGAHSPYEVFSDWIRCCSLSICNTVHVIHDDVWQQRERDYIETIRRYPEGTEYRFAGMLCMLGDLLTEEMTDALGEIYMEAGMGSKTAGQFFTPFHVAELTAKMAIQDSIKSFKAKMTKLITLTEPSVGGGGMVIATAKVLKEAGINYQKYLDVVAQDLDWKGVYMTYLQCSLLGIRATVVQGDTLSAPFDAKRTHPRHVMRTPAKMGALI
jgi:type I restriction-modification system DNA methylase subunit